MIEQTLRVEVPVNDLLRVLQLAAASPLATSEDSAPCQRAADFVDAVCEVSVSTPLGDNQTARQFVDWVLEFMGAAQNDS